MHTLLINFFFIGLSIGIIAALYLNRKLDTIMASQEELAAEIRASNLQIRKAIDEVTAEIAVLEEALRNNPPHPDIVAAVAELKTASQAADDVVPDAPAPAP